MRKTVNLVLKCVAALSMAALLAGCTLNVTSTSDANLKFINNIRENIIGGTVTYSVTNIQALGQVWADTVLYGDSSLAEVVSPHTGAFVVTGDIKSSFGTWVALTWNETQDIVKGENYAITLTYTKANVLFANNIKENITGGILPYSVTNIQALGQTWSDTVVYGDSSVTSAVSPHTGAFSITGQIKSPFGTWVASSWSGNQDIVEGQSYVIILTYANTPSIANVQFLNNNSTPIIGGIVQYSARNIAGLSQTWADSIGYGDKTASKTVFPHTGAFTVSGEVKAPGGTWTAGTWDETQEILAGQNYVIELTM